MLQGVILAGGRGERFWPLSRRHRPKQLLRLFGDQTLLRSTWTRLRHRLNAEDIWVITGDDLVPAVQGELPELASARIVAEVAGKSTGPACAVAAALGVRRGADPIQLVAPSDHLVPDVEAFWTAVDQAAQLIDQQPQRLVTFGIPISEPDTGYGYIERAAPIDSAENAWDVAHFHEKPDEETARTYQASGDCYWNSGIFVWRPQAFLAELFGHMPKLHTLVMPLIGANDPISMLDDIFRRAESVPVDVGVLERSQQVAVIPAGFAWDDVGTWDRWAKLAAGEDGNATAGQVLALESEGCALFADDGLVVTLGLKDLVVVRSGDVTLVLPKSRASEIKSILEALRESREDLGDRT